MASPNTIINEELKSEIGKLSIQDKRIESMIPITGTSIGGDWIRSGVSNIPSNNLKRRNSVKTNTFIEIRKLNKKTEKLLNHNLIEFASHYVNNFVKTTNKDWQITRNFVTSMIEVH